MPEPLTLIAVAFISALAGVSGSWLTGLQGLRREREAREAEQHASQRQAKADAYVTLLQELQTLSSFADGHMIAGQGPIRNPDLAARVHHAEVAAQVRAPADVWARVEPYVRAVSLRANALAASGAMERLKQEGWDDGDVVQGLYLDALDAIRIDLAAT